MGSGSGSGSVSDERLQITISFFPLNSLSLSLSADFNFLSNKTFSFSCEAIKASFWISVLALEFGKKWRSVDISYVSFCLGFYFAFLLNCCFSFFFFFFAFTLSLSNLRVKEALEFV